MRVDPFFVSNLAGSLNQTQSSVQQLTNELSSGVRVTSVSEDPVAAGENVLLLNQIQKDDSFTQTSSLVQGQLQVGDSALGSVVDQLTQALTLATSANNGTLTSTQLQSISNQLSGILDEVTSLANTSYQGLYIFGGSITSTQPFTTTASATPGAPGTTTYNGDQTANYLETPNGQKIQLNIPGDQIFAGTGNNNVFAALNQLVADYASGASTQQSVQDTQALSTALNYVTSQRVALDNSLTRLSATSGAITSESTQLTAAQTTLMQADIPGISTKLALAETQQTALEDLISQLGSGSLFDKLS
jgi:flagellar hook-associated protein 3 FlgL